MQIAQILPNITGAHEDHRNYVGISMMALSTSQGCKAVKIRLQKYGVIALHTKISNVYRGFG